MFVEGKTILCVHSEPAFFSTLASFTTILSFLNSEALLSIEETWLSFKASPREFSYLNKISTLDFVASEGFGLTATKGTYLISCYYSKTAKRSAPVRIPSSFVLKKL